MHNSVDQEFLYVRDLMTLGVITCSPTASITEIAQSFFINQNEAIVVMDNGHALGYITHKEVLQSYIKEKYDDITASDVMIEDIPKISPDIPLKTAAKLMLDRDLKVFFIMHHSGGNEYPTAFISFRYFIRLIGSSKPEDLKDLGVNAERKLPLDAFIKKRDLALRKNRLVE